MDALRDGGLQGGVKQLEGRPEDIAKLLKGDKSGRRTVTYAIRPVAGDPSPRMQAWTSQVETLIKR